MEYTRFVSAVKTPVFVLWDEMFLNQKSRFTPAVRMGLSISVATGLYGISFGALAVAAGLNVWQAMALSALMFTGGSQFAFIGVIAGGGAGSAALGAASLLGVRNAVYGMQMNRILQPSGWRKWLAAQVTIDESAATASGQRDPAEQQRGFWTAGIGVFVLWNAFTLLGAMLGDALGDPRKWGWMVRPWQLFWGCYGRVCSSASRWRWPCCAAWSRLWRCRCCRRACRFWSLPWWVQPGGGGAVRGWPRKR
ncbi:AzlC family ABC transporter permease [Comamonas jiangduensis]|uniref:AzlC family ABC transporter permease n=1 Tax=Comamonas jiangduensis TaxID=1194168 RepID=UPI003BF7D306